MTVNRRTIVVAVSLLILLVAFTPALSARKTIITFMGWGNPEENEIFSELVAQFEEDYPDVMVNYINVPPAEFMVKLQAMVAGNRAPDVFYFPADQLMPWVDSGRLLNLTEMVHQTEIFDEDNIWPQALGRYRYDGERVGVGDIWALPKDVGPWALAYNKDLFREAGVPFPDKDEPWTWDEFVENAKKLTKGSGTSKQWGAASYTLESAVWANGADWLDESKTKITVDDPKFIEAMQWVADLTLVHKVTPSVEESQSMSGYQRWMNGQIAMFPMGPWDQPAFWELPFEWDLMPWPASPNTGKNATWMGSMGFAVSSSSKHKEEAFALACYLAFSEKGQRSNYQMGMAVPNLIDMAKTEFLEMDKPPANREEFIQIIEEYGRRFPPEFTYDNEWWNAFWSGADAVWTGRKTAEEYCKEVAPKLQEMLDRGIEKQMQMRAKRK